MDWRETEEEKTYFDRLEARLSLGPPPSLPMTHDDAECIVELLTQMVQRLDDLIRLAR